MAGKWIELTDELHAYVVDHGMPPDRVQRDLIAETRTLGDRAGMLLAPEEGALLGWLTRLIGAKEAVEVGTFTGYSALAVARELPPEGRLLCCDVSEEWTAIARRYWERAGVADRIELRIGPAADTLRALPEEERFDLALIDADKTGYPLYFEEILKRTRPGGVICVDNVLWHGRVVDPSVDDDDTRAIRAFNDAAVADERVDVVVLPIGDGLSLLRKRG
ncbi:MAG: O-methyltransferase [Frankiaceae bacterium]